MLMVSKKRRYLAESEKYLKEYNLTRDDNARGNISDSLVRLADTQTPFRYRKRSDLLRTIRMASLDKKSRGSEKHSIRDEFLGEFHGFAPPVYLAHGDICPFCNEQLKRETDFSLICQSCGVNVQIQDATSNAVSWNDDMDYVSFQYKRANHFCEWVNTSMAKQNCDVPIQVLRDCMSRLAREKVKPEQIDSIRIRQVLKELKLRKYYEHSLLISCIDAEDVRHLALQELRDRPAFTVSLAPVIVRGARALHRLEALEEEQDVEDAVGRRVDLDEAPHICRRRVRERRVLGKRVEEQLLEADLLVRVVRRELRAELVRERLGERPMRQHLAEEEAIHAEASVRGRRQRRARFVLELGPGRGGHHTGL